MCGAVITKTRRLYLPLVLLFFLLGCSQAEVATPLPEPSLWGTIHTVVEVEQSAAPALWATDTRVTTSWIGSDDSGVHQDARMWENGSLSDTVVLPLPPNYPFAQQILPAAQEANHLLWLDASDEVEGQNRLYSALITPELNVERGPTTISDQLTLRYAAVPAGDGGVWVVWSGGLLAEPALYAQYIDNVGRPRQPNLIERGADFPALVRANDGTIYLLWLQTEPLYTYIRQGVLNNGTLVKADSFAILSLDIDDQLLDLYAGLDQTHLYVFLNIDGAAAAGTSSSMIERPLDSAVWSQPAYLGVNSGQLAVVETGFNTGLANDAQTTDRWLQMSWVRPLSGQFDALPIAGYLDTASAETLDQLTVAYFRAGKIIGYQPIVSLPTTLLAPPGLYTDRDRHLYLAWSEPLAVGFAALKWTSTRG